MRMLIHAKFPHEPFNTLVRSGKAGEVIQKVLAEIKPEAVYFTEYRGAPGINLHRRYLGRLQDPFNRRAPLPELQRRRRVPPSHAP